eukprot:COSAG01_NODE_335_length_18690_cov_7.693185_19_plen_54_part_00
MRVGGACRHHHISRLYLPTPHALGTPIAGPNGDSLYLANTNGRVKLNIGLGPV